MTIKEYKFALQSSADGVTSDAISTVIVPAGNRMLATIQNRIIREGEGTSGAKMKEYSTKEAYYTKEQFVKKSAFKAIGKNPEKKSVKTDEVSHKSMYLEHGYKELREIQGRETKVTNLFYTGDLMKSFILGQTADSAQIGFDNEKQSLKRQGLESKYDMDIFYPSASEIEAYTQEAFSGLKEIIITKLTHG